MTIEDTANAIAGTIPLIVVSGVAMKMTDSMFGGNKNRQTTKKKVVRSKGRKSRRTYRPI